MMMNSLILVTLLCHTLVLGKRVFVLNNGVKDINRNTCADRADGAYSSEGFGSIYKGKNFLAHICCDGETHDVQCADLCTCGSTPGVACYGSPANCEEVYVEVADNHKSLTCYASFQKEGSDELFREKKIIPAADYCAYYGERLMPKDKSLAGQQSGILASEIGAWQAIVDENTGMSSTGVIAIHAVLLPFTSQILYWDRLSTPDTLEQPGAYQTASAVFDTDTGVVKRAPVSEAPFCSGQTHLIDNRIFVAGGEEESMPWTREWAVAKGWEEENLMTEGRKSIRTFDPVAMEWTTLEAELPASHWYPTHLVVPDGRVLSLGGWESVAGGLTLNVEIFDPSTNTLVKNFTSIPFTEAIQGINLYPSVLLLPDYDETAPDDVFILLYSCIYGQIVKLSKDNEITVVDIMPDLPEEAKHFCSSYSALGSSQLLALRPENDYAAEYIMMGGMTTPEGFVDVINGQLTSRGPDAAAICSCNIAGSHLSARIPVGAKGTADSEWEIERMPVARVAGQMVVLPNGQVILFNGAEFGMGNDYQRGPVYQPTLYEPLKPAGQRYSLLAASNTTRLYHSTAVLVPDGTVVIAGQDQGECTGELMCGTNYVYHYNAEKFTPPSIAGDAIRPVIKDVANEVALGDELEIMYSGVEKIDRVSIVRPAAVTHSVDMSSRVVFVPILEQTDSVLTVQMPEEKTRAVIGGAHMVFIMTGDTYSEGQWINVTTTERWEAPPKKMRRLYPRKM